MIKIEKPNTAPKILTEKGKEATEELIKQYLANAKSYQQGNVKFEFDKKIYAHSSVKKALKKCQSDKCCFCERKTEVGDVEHFRGKGGFQQDENEPLQFPGYFRLAYEWHNLLFCCETCNRSFKRNFFPLENPAERATSHLDDISKEKPLIINPTEEDPENYIEYVGSFPRAINGNKKGVETIKRIGLDRPFIDDRRRSHYLILKHVFQTANEPSLPLAKRKELMDLVKKSRRC